MDFDLILLNLLLGLVDLFLARLCVLGFLLVPSEVGLEDLAWFLASLEELVELLQFRKFVSLFLDGCLGFLHACLVLLGDALLMVAKNGHFPVAVFVELDLLFNCVIIGIYFTLIEFVLKRD